MRRAREFDRAVQRLRSVLALQIQERLAAAADILEAAGALEGLRQRGEARESAGARAAAGAVHRELSLSKEYIGSPKWQKHDF